MQELKKIHELTDAARVARLDGFDFIEKLGVNVLCREYNGIGPEFLPPVLRDKVTAFLAIFEPAALIHDLRNYKSDGTRYAFNYANMEFFINCRKCAARKYPWWNWKRYRAYFIARHLYNFVSGSPGWKAWMDCYEKTHNNPKEQT